MYVKSQLFVRLRNELLYSKSPYFLHSFLILALYLFCKEYSYVWTYEYERMLNFPSGSEVKNLPVSAEDAGDMGSIRGSGRCPWGGNDNQLQFSCLKSPKDREAWRVILHGVTKVRNNLATNQQKRFIISKIICNTFWQTT